jgi:exopolyphosphatase/guanosine-5'-triphosphate,3'-diphosphate pyrophosphatase
MSETERVARVEAWVREHDPEPSHALQVTKVSLHLFDSLTFLHGLSDEERDLLHAGALLHDIGYTIDAWRHHKHARDLIMSMDLPGFDARDRRIIACLARYHRKGHPKPTHKVYCDLGEKDQLILRKLAALLRIGDGLDRSHRDATQAVQMDRRGNLLRMIVLQTPPNGVDLYGANKKRGLFEEVFGLHVEVLGAAD